MAGLSWARLSVAPAMKTGPPEATARDVVFAEILTAAAILPVSCGEHRITKKYPQFLCDAIGDFVEPFVSNSLTPELWKHGPC